jgi:hypothetical protein
MAPTPDGRGYWLVASDGGVFTFGDAAFYGSAADTPGDPVQQLIPIRSGQGYWIVQQSGTEVALGDAAGSAPTTAVLLSPITPGDRAVLFALQQLGKALHLGRQRSHRLRLLGTRPRRVEPG